MKALNHVLVALVVVVALVSINRAKAEEAATTASNDTPTWEWTGSTAANYTHSTSAGQGSHQFNVGLGGNYFFNNMYELGLTVNAISASQSGVTVKQLQILVGPTFNFFGAPENAFYLTLQGGLLLTGASSDQVPTSPNFTQFSYLAGVGKRVEIVKHVTWKPEVAITGSLSNTDSATGSNLATTTSFEIIPFQFSLLF